MELQTCIVHVEVQTLLTEHYYSIEIGDYIFR